MNIATILVGTYKGRTVNVISAKDGFANVEIRKGTYLRYPESSLRYVPTVNGKMTRIQEIVNARFEAEAAYTKYEDKKAEVAKLTQEEWRHYTDADAHSESLLENFLKDSWQWLQLAVKGSSFEGLTVLKKCNVTSTLTPEDCTLHYDTAEGAFELKDYDEYTVFSFKLDDSFSPEKISLEETVKKERKQALEIAIATTEAFLQQKKKELEALES